MAKLNVILRDSGGNSKAGYRVAVYNDANELVYDTNLGTMIDNGDGSYISSTEANPGSYTVKYATTSSGTLAVVPGYEDFSFGAVFEGTASIANGGTGATTVEGAQQNLGVEPGVDVLVQDDRFDTMKSTADSLHNSNLDGICVSDKTNGNFAFVEPSVAREKLELEPGVDVMAYDSTLQEFADMTHPVSGVAFPQFVVGDAWYSLGPSTTRTNLGLGSVATESTVPIEKGGTGATTKLGAQQALDLEPGVDIQGHSDFLDDIALLTRPVFDNVDILVMTEGGIGSFDAVSFIGEDVLNLGTVATEDVTTSGETGKVPKFDANVIHLPLATASPALSEGNVGKLFFLTNGDPDTGSFGLYYVGRKSVGGPAANYTYELVTVFSRTWS